SFGPLDRADGGVELLTLHGQHVLLAPQGLGERRLPLQQSADLPERQPEKLQDDDLFEAREIAVTIQPVARGGSPPRLQQSETVVVMQGSHGDAGELRKLLRPIDGSGGLHDASRGWWGLTLREGQIISFPARSDR